MLAEMSERVSGLDHKTTRWADRTVGGFIQDGSRGLIPHRFELVRTELLGCMVLDSCAGSVADGRDGIQRRLFSIEVLACRYDLAVGAY
jgi:hypothetical protein